MKGVTLLIESGGVKSSFVCPILTEGFDTADLQDARVLLEALAEERWQRRPIMHPPQTVIDELIQRIVGAVHPLRILLFGSAARGEMRSDSDVDVLIVMPEGVHRRRMAQDIHEQLFGFPVSVDVLVATPEDLRKHKDNIGLVYHRILREGKEIYAA